MSGRATVSRAVLKLWEFTPIFDDVGDSCAVPKTTQPGRGPGPRLREHVAAAASLLTTNE